MVRKIVFLLSTTIFFYGCSSSTSKKPRIPEPETLKTIKDVRRGLGEQCIDFHDKYTISTTEGGQMIVDEVTMFNLEVENGVQKYYFAQDLNSERITISDILSSFNLRDSIGGNIKELVKLHFLNYLRRSTNKVIDFLVGGLDASGEIVDKSFDFTYEIPFSNDIEFSFPIKYSIDCFDNITSIHFLIDSFAIRMVYEEQENGTIFVESREINESGDGILVNSGVLTPLEDQPLSRQPHLSPAGLVAEEELAIEEDLSVVGQKAIQLSVSMLLEENLTENQKFFIALYNKNSEDYVVLEPNVVFTEDSASFDDIKVTLPLRALREFNSLWSDNWDLVVSSTYLKTPIAIYSDYYFPIKRDESIIVDDSVQVIATSENLSSCIQSNQCEGLFSGLSSGVQIFNPSTNEGGQVAFTFDTALIEFNEIAPENMPRCVARAGSCNVFDSRED